MEKINGFILYLDIIGYRSLMESPYVQELERFFDWLSDDQMERNLYLSFDSNYKNRNIIYRFFSDNLLIVCESSKDNLEDFARMMALNSYLQWQCFMLGILTRGSIRYGEISYNDKLLFGLDLVETVKLEENHSEPCVIVDEKLNILYERWLKSYYSRNGSSVFNKRRTKKYYVCPPFCTHWPKALELVDCICGAKKYFSYFERIPLEKAHLEKTKWVIEEINNFFSLKEEYGLSLDMSKDCYEFKQGNVSLVSGLITELEV